MSSTIIVSHCYWKCNVMQIFEYEYNGSIFKLAGGICDLDIM